MSATTSNDTSSPRVSPGGRESETVVRLRAPARLDHIAVVRSVAARLAMLADHPVDAVADFEMAVEEVCVGHVPIALGLSQLDCRFELSATGARFTVSVAVDNVVDRMPQPPSFGALSSHLLATLTDELSTELRTTATRATVRTTIVTSVSSH